MKSTFGTIRCLFSFLFFAGLSIATQAGEVWTFACSPENDLYRVMSDCGYECARFDSPDLAIERAEKKTVVLILADRYPLHKTGMDQSLWDRAKEKNLRLFVEFPDYIPGMACGEIQAARWERGVAVSNEFGSSLPPLSLLAIHDCHYFKVNANSPSIVLARAAGYNRAIFGLPKDTHPILFRNSEQSAWIAVTKLSQFRTARYSPYESWRSIWRYLLSDLCGHSVPELIWEQIVRPIGQNADRPLAQIEVETLKRGAEWFVKSRLLVHPSDEEKIDAHLKQGSSESQSYAAGWMSAESRILPSPDLPLGDGSNGFLEGYSSQVLYDGSQLQRIIRRSDCMAEAAMGLAVGGEFHRDSSVPYSEYSKNLLDYVYFKSSAQQGVRADPKHPAYGLIAWGTTNWAWERATYGDDMARVMLATLAAAALMKSDRWDEGVLKCILGSFRTAGTLGFREDCIDISSLEKNGWKHYFQDSYQNFAPHYQAYLWACYLWAYHQTRYEPFLEKAKSAIRLTMAAYPDGWRWTNGIQQERARMLLPLSWLVRIDDTPEHRAWLRKMADDLLALQVDCGAIREEMGKWENGTIRPPKSNEEYGTGETPLIQVNGDPACDLLYTSNFAFLGLNEAAHATGDSYYKNACDRLAEFLCRIQIHSNTHKVLDGGWFRAFDFKRWEYWASNADAGWGAWCIESGWTQGWIVATMGFRQKNTSLWYLTEPSSIERHFERLLPVFLPKEEE